MAENNKKNKPNENPTMTESQANPEIKPKFSVERLCVDCRELFNVSTSTYDAATYALEGTYTVEEMRTHIEEWCGLSAIPEKKEEK